MAPWHTHPARKWSPHLPLCGLPSPFGRGLWGEWVACPLARWEGSRRRRPGEGL